jgi:hypothetical protein
MGTVHVLEQRRDLDAALRQALLVQRAADASATISARLAAVAMELRQAAQHYSTTGNLMLRLAGDLDRFAVEGRTSCFSFD